MPVIYRCLPDGQLALNVFDGEVTFEEWAEMLARQVEDPAWLATTKGVTDLSTAAFPTLSPNELDVIQGQYARRADRSAGRKMAMVANQSWDAAQLLGDEAISRLMAKAMVFNDLTTACAWLGVDVRTVRDAAYELRDQLRPPKGRAGA